MSGITYKVLAANGRNVTVRYTKGANSIEVGMDLPLGANAEQIEATIKQMTPYGWFERIENPVAVDAFAALVDQEGTADVAPPEAPGLVPQTVTRGQGRAALYQAGLLEIVEGMMSHPDTPMIQKLAWQDALTFERNSPTMAAMAGALGLTGAQLDQLFITAAAIRL